MLDCKTDAGPKIYLQATNEVDKESDKLDISVSNVKDIIYDFLSLCNKYGWGCLAFMVVTDAGPKIYLQATNEVDKESDKLDISVSNVKDIIYHFLWKWLLRSEERRVELVYDDKSSTDTHKPVQQHIHQSKSSYGFFSGELCA